MTRNNLLKCLGVFVFFLFSCTLSAQRDPYLQPFAINSIWNMAIHNDAVYVDAQMSNLPLGG